MREGSVAWCRLWRRRFRVRSISCCIPYPATHPQSAFPPASELCMARQRCTAPVPEAAAVTQGAALLWVPVLQRHDTQ